MDPLETNSPTDRAVALFDESSVSYFIIDQLFSEATTKVTSLTLLEDAKKLGVNIASITNDKGQTLLHVAAGYGRINLVKLLIEEGADINAQDIEGQAPLHYACNHAHTTVASFLISHRAKIDLRDSRGWSPLHFALARRENVEQISSRYWRVVELLLAFNADPYLTTNSGKSCFNRVKDSKQRLFMHRESFEFFEERLRNCDDPKTRLATIEKYFKVEDFFELVKEGDAVIKIIKEILTQKFVRSRLRSCNNITPLHRAAGYNHIELAELLIENGADVNATDDHGQVPLHNAARYGHVEMIELLISRNCDINTQDTDGMSPIHVSAISKNFAACLRLIDSGADVGIKASNGKLPYDLAETDDVRQVLKIDGVPQEFNPPASSQSQLDQAIYIGIRKKPHDPKSGPTDVLMLDSRKDEPLFKNSKHILKKISLKEDDHRYQLVRERMMNTIKCHPIDTGGTFTSYEIIRIDYMLHETVWQKYKKYCEILELHGSPRSEKLLFHGSTPYLIDKIQMEGFDHRYANRDGMFGAGIYFAADSSKSNQYTFGFGQGCSKHRDKSCSKCERKIIYAQVALGKTLVSSQAMPNLSHPPPGYWSVSGEPDITEGLKYPEHVIYNGEQAYPLFVITYRIKH